MSFGERLASSQAFADLFRDGMALVEETATYLDGPGRQESKKLERAAALAYATESMRLTTRLMQLASWLLLHRAVKEGEMSLAQANKEKAKVKLSAGEHGDEQNIKLLPERLRVLIQRSKALQSAVRRLDATIHASAAPARAAAAIRSSASSACSRPPSSRSDSCRLELTLAKRKAPARAGALRLAQQARRAISSRPRPANFFWKRESRPPRSSSCCWPPVQAGCDFGSMSRCSVSPSLPQVVRVVNSVPSVITTLMV